MNTTALIIATKDRPSELRRLLQSIGRQSLTPARIVVVDSGMIRASDVMKEFPGLPLAYFYTLPPSAARQRNAGLFEVPASAEFIGFVDDDAVFEPDAFHEMSAFWRRAQPDTAGAAFNLMNHPALVAPSLKNNPLAEKMGFYSSRKGVVLGNGFQTMIGAVGQDTPVKWLPSGAVVWKKSIFSNIRFDEWYTGYSYLEDLDFSYSVGKAHRLYVVSRAKFLHLPSSQGRSDDYTFGKKEISHRLHFVGKNPELSRSKCYQALTVRMIMSLALGIKTGRASFLKRAHGNLVGLAESIF